MPQSTSFIRKFTCISPIYNKLQRLSAKVLLCGMQTPFTIWRYCLISLCLASYYHFDVQMYNITTLTYRCT